MASKAIQALRRTVEVRWPQQQEAQAKAFLIRTAKEGHARIMREQGNPAFEAYANSPGRPVESVILPGPIVYKYSNVRRIVEVALDELHKASPVLSGDYARGHTVFLNGVPVEVLPESISPSDEIMIANLVPYARRIEIGKTQSGRDFVIQVENRIYERVVKNVLMPRYRNVAKISFGYIAIPEAYRLKKDQPARHWLKNKRRWYVEPNQRKDRVAGTAVRSPAIIIERLT